MELHASPRQHPVELLVRMAALFDHGLVDPKGPLKAPWLSGGRPGASRTELLFGKPGRKFDEVGFEVR